MIAQNNLNGCLKQPNKLMETTAVFDLFNEMQWYVLER